MLRILCLVLSFFLAIPTAHAQLQIEEEDGAPIIWPWSLKVTNGTLTDNGDGTASLTTGGGGGGSESTTVSDTAEIDLTLAGVDISGVLVAGSIDETKLDTSTNASLDLADSALQSETSHADVIVDGDFTPAFGFLVQQSGTGSPQILSVGADTIVGRVTGGASEIDDLTPTQVRTLINVEDGSTADQSAGEIEAIVSHDNLVGFVANEHIDWTGASAGTIHATNYVDNNTTYTSSDFTHDDLTGFVANEHIDWTGASAGTIHATNYSDTDTQLTEEQVEDFVGGMLGGTETDIAVTYQDVTNDIDFVIDSGVTRDSEWDTLAEINAASTDTDAVLDTDIGSTVQAHSAVLDATTASFLTADETKLDGIEALADVTDTTNVTSAGALMDSEVDVDIKTLTIGASATVTGSNTGDQTTITGNAGTATALAANGANCTAGSYALGVDASGAAESCTDATTEINSAISTHASDADAHQDLVTLAGTPDYITLAGQVITRGTIDIGDDTNLTAGRSLTLTGDSVAADTELYTDTKGIWFESPTADDDFKSIWTANGFAATITKIWCESDQTVNLDLQVDDGAPADVNGADLVCDSTPAEDESMGGDATLADGDRLDLAITSVSGDPTWVSVHWTYTKDD